MMSLRFFVLFAFFTLLITAQDVPSGAPAPVTTNAGGTISGAEFKKVLAEVESSRQVLDTISRNLNPIAEGLHKLDSASARSQETLQTISSLSENIKKIQTLVEHVPQKVAEAGASSSKQGDFQTSLTSQLNSLQTLVTNQKASFDDLRSTLATILEHTKGVEQLNKGQKSSAKQTELLEKLLSNQDALLKNQNKIISKLDRNLTETMGVYWAKVRNGTHEVTQFISDAFSGKKGTAGANLKKSTNALLSQATVFTTKASSQGQDLVIKYHGELSNHLKQFGIPEPYHVYAATAILTIPLSLLALLIVSLTFKILRILGSIVFYPLYCCFRRRVRPEEAESKKRKSSEVESTLSSSRSKKQHTNQHTNQHISQARK